MTLKTAADVRTGMLKIYSHKYISIHQFPEI